MDLPIVIKDFPLRLVQHLQQLFFEMSKFDGEFALQFQQVRSLLINVRSLSLEHLVETLTLQTASRYSEVDKGHSRTDIRSKFNLKSTSPVN